MQQREIAHERDGLRAGDGGGAGGAGDDPVDAVQPAVHQHSTPPRRERVHVADRHAARHVEQVRCQRRFAGDERLSPITFGKGHFEGTAGAPLGAFEQTPEGTFGAR